MAKRIQLLYMYVYTYLGSSRNIVVLPSQIISLGIMLAFGENVLLGKNINTYTKGHWLHSNFSSKINRESRFCIDCFLSNVFIWGKPKGPPDHQKIKDKQSQSYDSFSLFKWEKHF